MNILKILKEKKYITAYCLYAVIFAVIWLLLYGSSEYLFDYGSDIYTFSYPILLKLREFYQELFRGNFSVIDFDRLFGIDIIMRSGYVGNPLFFATAFLSDSGLMHFFKDFAMTMMFFSGISFIYMCSYFGKDPIRSALLSPLYLCCPYLIYYSICFYCFLPNFVSLPIIIVAMEKVLRKESGKMLVISSALICIFCSIYFWIYNVFLAAVFAFVRCCFMEEENLFKRLWRYGLKGGMCAFGGLIFAAFAAFPMFEGILSSGRLSGSHVSVLSSLFDFDYESYLNLFCSNTNYISIGQLQCIFVFMFLIHKGSKKETKTLFLLSILAILFPTLISALNGFTYIEHRWAFALSLLSAYAAVCVAESISDFSETERIIGAVVLSLYMLSLDYILTTFSITAAIILIAVTNIGVVRKYLDKATAAVNNKHSNLLQLIVVLLSVMIVVFLIIMDSDPKITLKALICEAAIIIVITSGKGIKIAHAPIIAAAGFFIYFSRSFLCPSLDVSDIYDQMYEPLVNIRDHELEVSEPPIRFESYDDKENQNQAGNYDISGNSAMFSIIPGRYLSFMNKSGFDCNTYQMVNSAVGFDRRMPYLSVFGIDFLTDKNIDTEKLSYDKAAYPDTIPFGFEKYSDHSTSEGSYSVYKNKYSLPFGFTYKNVMNEADKEKLNGADYGINLLYGASVESDVTAENIRTITPYTHELSFNSTESIKIYESSNETYYLYELIPEQPITGSELYLSVFNTPSDDLYSTLKISTDSGITKLGKLYDAVFMGNFNWAVKLDSYSIRIGDIGSEQVNSINIVSSFPIEKMELTVLPHSEFEECFNELNRYTMENVSFGIDTVSGDIYVPEQRVLAMSLQYDKNWTAYDNGKKVDIFPVNECMTGLMLSGGDHSITLRYNNRYFTYGVVISVISVIGCAASLAIIARRKKTI